MPSLDIVCRIDLQEVDNAVNNAKKQLAQRFDFRGVRCDIDLDRKEKVLNVVTEDGTKMKAVQEMLQTCAMRRGIDIKSLKFGEPIPTTAGMLKREVKLLDGIEQEAAKDIVRRIKDTKLKVQASIQGDEIRLTGKQIDDLRAVMAHLQAAEIDLPLKFTNFKS